MMRDVILPEFDCSKHIDSQDAFVFDGDCRCDVILGRDFPWKMGMQLDFSSDRVQWMEHLVPTKEATAPEDPHHFLLNPWNEDVIDEEIDSFATDALEVKCEKVDPATVADQQKHLAPVQRKELATLLSKFDELFDGTLGRHPHKKTHLKVDPQAVPVHSRAHSVPRAHDVVLKEEPQHLVKMGVL